MVGISAILTAAGESTRMGRLKPLLPWHYGTLLEYQTATLREAGLSEVVVGLGHEADSIQPYVTGPGIRSVVNPDFRLGRVTSIKAGLRASDPDADGILLLGVDQPRNVQVISAIIDSHVREQALITSPRFKGRGGHPLAFAASLKLELEAISEQTEGIRGIFRAHRTEVNEVVMGDAIVCLDLNTPEQYEKAKTRYGM